MAQITNGLRSLLSNPYIYSAFQTLFGGHQARKNFVNEFIQPMPNINVLDVGCGPADIFEYLPSCQYWGFDISKSYIDRAKAKYGSKGNFICKELDFLDLESLPKFDLVLTLGLIHHLDDATAHAVLDLCYNALNDDGKLVTIDPCFHPEQNPIAKFLIRNDRGQNVRSESEYKFLVNQFFPNSVVTVRHQSWIPYTHCIMVCHM